MVINDSAKTGSASGPDDAGFEELVGRQEYHYRFSHTHWPQKVCDIQAKSGSTNIDHLAIPESCSLGFSSGDFLKLC